MESTTDRLSNARVSSSALQPLASLLARAYLRYRQNTRVAADSAPTSLEVPLPIRLSVPTGLLPREPLVEPDSEGNER